MAVVAQVVLLALGNLAASRAMPAVAGVPRAEATPVRVLAETLAVTCEDQQQLPSCAVRAEYTVHNPTEAEQVVQAEFLGVRTSAVRATRDGKELPRPADGDQAAVERLRGRLDAAGARVAARTDEVAHAPFELRLAAGETAQVVVTAQMSPGRYFAPTYAMAPVKARHMLLASDVPRSDTFHLEYLVGPIRTWGGEGEARAKAPVIEVTLAHPARWGVVVSERRAEGLAAVAATASEAEGVRTLRFSVDAEQVDELEAALDLPPRVFFNGGLQLGVGGAVGAPSALRVRLGYEVAAPAWLGWSLAAETAFGGDLLLVPAVEAQTPSVMFIIPSLGAGLGVPVRVLPERRVGVRVQASVHWPLVGVVLALDVFPLAAAPVQFAVLGQVGL